MKRYLKINFGIKTILSLMVTYFEFVFVDVFPQAYQCISTTLIKFLYQSSDIFTPVITISIKIYKTIMNG
ncbi:hypothetical protein EG352_07815 [Chryseobacterium indologenes]|uniref:Uncharacterized protein n=1 Tax=Chryseobacterium indologenes TaxID=253 RepID=A0AAD1DUC9_CHRID|nr:hypothetical protein EG352_07815 [Chryseobacterium indologenes]